MSRLITTFLASALLSSPAAAQYIGGRAPAPPTAPVNGYAESPEAALARNVRLLAINPRDYNALLGAGRAALRLNDAQAAVGFFGRAEELNPAHWAPKAGQGSALTQMGEGNAALGMFEQAQRLGATQSLIALDRGLAFDLLGRQAEAQSDYRAVLTGADQAEARRRLALSLAISGSRSEALTALDPLLAQRDAGARRARAFILALGGDVDGARLAISQVMPGVGSGFDPFLRRLSTLGPGQKAAAVHLGMMPAEGAALAQVQEPVQPALPPIRVAQARPIAAAVVEKKITAAPVADADRLADIETTLSKLPATLAPPPAPKPIVERSITRRKAAPERTLASRPASDDDEDAAGKGKQTARKGTKLAEKEPAPAKGKAAEAKTSTKPSSSRIYVQLAGGANADRMTNEYERIRKSKAALFRSRQPFVSEVKGWARLLVGPFKDGEEAQEFVNDLHAAKLAGFVWTAPPGTKFEKLAAK